MVEHNLSVVEGLCDTHHRADPRPGARRRRLRDRVAQSRGVAAYLGTADALRRRCSKCRGLELRWYGESHILHGVDFDVREGEVVTLLGRNGAGKTTTMKCIMGLVARRERPHPLQRAPRRSACVPDLIARAGIALCPEERGIFASLNVTENLMLPPWSRRAASTCRRSTRCSPT